jgi:predicted Rossmann fold flavoprotein
VANQTCDVLIIGAGAAGMMCAIEAGKRKRKVILLDHSDRIGRKILISGGGRCNFTNINTTPNSFVSQNPHFCKSALARYTPQDFISLVKSHRIKFHEKKLGQLFCDDSAQQIVDMLVKECDKSGSRFQLAREVERVSHDGHFTVRTNKGTVSSESLVIATGGLSIPQIGATGYGYELARQFGLKIIETRPALDGFNLNAKDLQRFSALSGVSVDVIASCDGSSFRENILFTHNGLSGPASLQTSLYWQKPLPLEINLLPEIAPVTWLTDMRTQKSRSNLKNLLTEVLPKRFAEQFCDYYGFKENLADLSDKRLHEIARSLASWQLFPSGTVGFKKAEVTRGGVDTNELSSKTMEAKKLAGLYFIGEVVDVTGQLGGYNFQWAWSSAFAAGQVV